MSNIDELIVRIQVLEEEMQVEFDKKRDDFQFVIDRRRARFSEELTQLQRISRVGLVRYVTGARLVSWLVAPVIYSGFLVFFALDLFLWIYQGICFPAYHITKVEPRRLRRLSTAGTCPTSTQSRRSTACTAATRTG